MGSEKERARAEQEAEAWGINVSLIEANLERTAAERLEVLQQALDTIFELRRAWDRAQRKDHPAKAAGT